MESIIIYPPEGGEDDALLQRLLGLHLARDVGEAAALARLYHLAHHNLERDLLADLKRYQLRVFTFMYLLLSEGFLLFEMLVLQGMEFLLVLEMLWDSELDMHLL